MQVQEYYRIERMEMTHFWYLGMRRLTFSLLAKHVRAPAKILDAGCGTGGLANDCAHFGYVAAIDINPTAIKFARKKNISSVKKASVCCLPFKSNFFDAVLCLDVLYHRDVPDDQEAERELYRVLKRGGVLILRVPAFEFLRGSHDIVVYTKKRYKASEIEKLVAGAGFHIIKLTYANMILSIPLFFKRFYERMFATKHKPHSDSALLPPLINKTFEGILLFEKKILEYANFPFGSSVICVCKKP